MDALVRGTEENTCYVQIFDRHVGTGPGVLRAEGTFPKEAVPYFTRLIQRTVSKRPNWNILIDGQRIEHQIQKGGKDEEQALALPEDEETKLLVVRKDELRIDIASKKAEREAMVREHDRQRALMAADIERMGKQVLAEEARLNSARDRADKALTGMETELESKRATLVHLGELEETMTRSAKERIEALDGEVNGRINREQKIDEKVKESLAKIEGQIGKKRLGEQVLDYVKDAAPSEAVSTLLSAGALKLAEKLGLSLGAPSKK